MKLAFSLLLLPSLALAITGQYKPLTTIPWSPKNSTSVDGSLVNNGSYYLSDRLNACIHVISLASLTETHTITGFVGLKKNATTGAAINSVSGPNGLVVSQKYSEIYTGDGDGSLKIVSLTSNSVVATVPLGFKKRADELTYDTKRDLIVITGPDEETPQLAFVSAATRSVVGRVLFPNATNGLEQPTYNPTDGFVYQSVPETDTNPGGEVDVVDTSAFKVTKVLKEDKCNAHGIVFGAGGALLLACSQDSIIANNQAQTEILNTTTGAIITTIKGIAGSDQAAYNPTLNLFYASDYQMTAGGAKTGASAPVLAIIDASTGTLLQTITTDNVTAHSVAVDPASNRVFVPLSKQGIQVYEWNSGSAATSASAKPSATAAASGAEIRIGRSAGLVLGLAGVVAVFML